MPMKLSIDLHLTGRSPLLLLLAAALLVLSSCDVVSPGDSGTTEYTKTVTADGENGQQLTGVTFVTPNRTKENATKIEVTGEEGTSITVRAKKAGYIEGSRSVSFADNTGVVITLKKDHPDTVQIEYEIRSDGSDTLVADDVYRKADGEVLARDSDSGTISYPYGTEPVTFCSQPDYFKEGCKQFTPDDNKPITIRVERKTVAGEASVTPNDGTLYVDGEEIATGSFSRDFPMQAGTRTISANADGYESQSKEVAADEAFDVEFSLTDLPACSDGVDNNGDGLIDEEDPGCVASNSPTRDPDDPDFIYDPDDDREGLTMVTESGKMSSHKRFVSSKDGERFQPLARITFDSSIQSAVGEIEVFVKNKIESNQDGEESAIWIAKAEVHTNPRITNVIPDDNSVNGWRESLYSGMRRSWVSNGLTYDIAAVDGTYARGEDPGNGDDDVFFSTDSETGEIIVRWYYEPEEL